MAAFIERNVERSCFCHCIWAASPSARERFRRSESATVSTWRAFCFSDAPAPDFVMPRLSDAVVVPRAQYIIGGIIPHYLHMFCSPMLPGTWNLHNLTTLANTCKLTGCPRQHVQAVCTFCQPHPHNISLRADRRQLPRYIWPSPRVLSTLSGLSLAHDKSQSLQANTPISTMNRRSDRSAITYLYAASSASASSQETGITMHTKRLLSIPNGVCPCMKEDFVWMMTV
jgi:hypothetical protein